MELPISDVTTSPLPRFSDCNDQVSEINAADIVIAATGDIVFSESEQINKTAFDQFAALFRTSDLVLGNLEGAITEVREPTKPYVPHRSYAFRFPPSVRNLLKDANINIISIANNHAFDYGQQGLSDTKFYLNQAGIDVIGLRGSYTIRKVKTLRIGVISLSHYPVFNNILNLDQSAKLIKQVKSEADLVMLYYQLGAEGEAAARLTGQQETFLAEDRGNARLFAAKMIEAGADLLIGHGPHVVRAIECLNSTPVLHSIGNFVGAGGLSTQGLANVSVIPQVLLDGQGRFKGLRAISVTFSAERNPLIDATGRGVYLVNMLGRMAKQIMPDFKPLTLKGYEGQDVTFTTWIDSMHYAAEFP